MLKRWRLLIWMQREEIEFRWEPEYSEKWFIEWLVLLRAFVTRIFFYQNNMPAFCKIDRTEKKYCRALHCMNCTHAFHQPKLYSNSWIFTQFLIIFIGFPYVLQCKPILYQIACNKRVSLTAKRTNGLNMRINRSCKQINNHIPECDAWTQQQTQRILYILMFFRKLTIDFMCTNTSKQNKICRMKKA